MYVTLSKHEVYVSRVGVETICDLVFTSHVLLLLQECDTWDVFSGSPLDPGSKDSVPVSLNGEMYGKLFINLF